MFALKMKKELETKDGEILLYVLLIVFVLSVLLARSIGMNNEIEKLQQTIKEMQSTSNAAVKEVQVIESAKTYSELNND